MREITEHGKPLVGSRDCLVLDAHGRTLMPGLIDAHVHASITTMSIAEALERPASCVAIETKLILESMLLRGFTTVRDTGGMDRGIIHALDRGLIRGPRVFRSGRSLSQTGGHGDFSPPDNLTFPCSCAAKIDRYCYVADGVDAVRRGVREQLKSGADQIKIMAGGGISSPTDSIDMVQYTEEEMRAAVDEAHSSRKYVLAHAYIPDSINRAVRAGVRSIEHGNLLDRDSASLMASRGCFLVPTLVAYDQLAKHGPARHYPPHMLEKLAIVRQAGLRSLEIARSEGVKVGFGTDLLGELHPAQSDEFIIRSEVHSALEILRSATLVNAELLNRSGTLGVLRPESAADLLLVNGDPLKDMRLLCGQGEHIDLIIRNGEIVKHCL